MRRLLDDDGLRDRLAAGAQPSVAAIGREPVYTRLEAILGEAALMTRPRVLFVGRGRLTLPLAPWLAKKWDALEEVFDVRVLNAGSGSGDPRFRLLPDRRPRVLPRLCRELVRELARSSRMSWSRATRSSARQFSPAVASLVRTPR